jgi:hypothetical protein
MNLSSSCRPLTLAVSLALAAGLFSGAASAHAISGAIYTSVENGDTVNANSYPSKDLVYSMADRTTRPVATAETLKMATTTSR